MCGFWSTHHLNYACGGVGQNESGGVKQCTGHFYLFIHVFHSFLNHFYPR